MANAIIYIKQKLEESNKKMKQNNEDLKTEFNKGLNTVELLIDNINRKYNNNLNII